MNQNQFKTNNIFTNSGIRDKAGSGYLQPQKLTTIAQAIATLLEEEFEDPCNILIAMDTRTSSPDIKQALLDGFADFDHEIYDAGICPTPFVAKALRDYQPSNDHSDQDEPEMDFDPEEEGFFDLGIVITASHNPAEYNGIKILTEFGYLTKDIEQEISALYHDLMDNPYESTDTIVTPISIDLVSFYQSAITQQISGDSLKSISVTLDCAHGATAQIAPRIFNSFGIKTFAYNNSTDGSLINTNSGCSNPCVLLEQMQKNNTPWGCAFDGDGDRVIIAHQSGKIFDGDDLLFLLNYHPDYQEFKTVVGTVMTNTGIERALQKMGKQLIRTYVGERNIIEQLIAKQAMIGSEPCGHITLMDHAFCSDGIFAALLFFDLVTTNPEVLTFEYQKYPQIHVTLPLTKKTVDKLMINSIISEHSSSQARIIIRQSNTESVLRIMVEHPDLQTTQDIATHVQKKCMDAFK